MRCFFFFGGWLIESYAYTLGGPHAGCEFGPCLFLENQGSFTPYVFRITRCRAGGDLLEL